MFPNIDADASFSACSARRDLVVTSAGAPYDCRPPGQFQSTMQGKADTTAETAREQANGPVERDFDPENSAGYLVRDLHLMFAKALRNRLHAHKVTPGQWFFLRALWIEEGLSQRELSRRVRTTEPTTVSALRLLERNGLIRRVRNSGDRRTINIYLTERGRALKTELLPYALELTDIATEGLSPAEFEEFRRIINRMKANLTAVAE